MDAKLTKYLEMMHVEGLRRCNKCWELRKAGVVTGGNVVRFKNTFDVEQPRLVRMPSKVAPWICQPCNAERIRAEKALAGCHVAIEGGQVKTV